MESKIEKLLLSFIDNEGNKTIYYRSQNSDDEKYLDSGESITNNSLMSLKDAEKLCTLPISKIAFGFIPESLYNKSFKIKDFKLHIGFKEEKTNMDESKNSWSFGYRNETCTIEKLISVVMEYNGYYYLLGECREKLYLTFSHGLPTQSNWRWLNFTEEKAYLKKEKSIYRNGQAWNHLEDVIKELVLITDKEETKCNYPMIYDYSSEYGHNLIKLSKKHTNIIWYILKDTSSDKVFKPSNNFINNIRFAIKPSDKNLLIELGIKVIYLRSKQHFNIKEYFNIDEDAMEVRGSKSVIKKYNLEKYTKDKNIIQEIAFEKKIAKDKDNFYKYHNSFTLIQHNKIILEDKSKEEIQKYLALHKVEYEFKNISKITKTKQISKELKENLTIYTGMDCTALTFSKLQELLYQEDVDTTNDTYYFYNNYTLTTDKYILETVGERYIKDSIICDEEMCGEITVKQLF